MKKLYILGTETKIKIDLLERCYPEFIGMWEGDWIKAGITVEIPGYSANFPADLRTDEFQVFREQLAAMDNELAGTASLISMEVQLKQKQAWIL